MTCRHCGVLPRCPESESKPDVPFGRNKAVAEEIPDGVDAQWDIDQNGDDKTWIILPSEKFEIFTKIQCFFHLYVII